MSSYYVTSSFTLTSPLSRQSPAANSSVSTCPTVYRASNDCPANFPCEHGQCVWENTGVMGGHVTGDSNLPSTHLSSVDAMRLVCQCDRGWLGTGCQTCCPLTCGNGTCATSVNASFICRCDWGYSGTRCDVFDPSNAGRSFKLN